MKLTAVDIEAFNSEIKDGDGFIGDRASNRAFRGILEQLREKIREVGEDPLGELPTKEISNKQLDKILTAGDPEAAGVVQGAIEGFAGELATVTARFLKIKAWKDVSRIAVGGGLRGSRIGELVIGRAGVILKADGNAVDMVPIRHHPDHAGLIGTVHLAPPWVFTGFDAVLAVDIGGSNIRVGIVELQTKKAKDFSECVVNHMELWRHVAEKTSRDEAVDRLIEMLQTLAKRAEKEKLALAPFIGVGCPGVTNEDGSIEKGAQNLPGNWESSRFNLPAKICELLPTVAGHDTHVVMHNDAVVQGLSQTPYMTDVDRWAVITIGTGLGNACFQNRSREVTKSESKARAEAKAEEKTEGEARAEAKAGAKS